MTRQEVIEQATKDMVSPYKECFVEGIQWADEHPDLYRVTRKAVERVLRNLWYDAQGDILPEIDREVIVLCDDGFKGYKVCFAHRPFAEGYDVKNLDGKVLDHITPRIYGKGGWSIPDVKWWLDADMPKEDEK